MSFGLESFRALVGLDGFPLTRMTFLASFISSSVSSSSAAGLTSRLLGSKEVAVDSRLDAGAATRNVEVPGMKSRTSKGPEAAGNVSASEPFSRG